MTWMMIWARQGAVEVVRGNVESGVDEGVGGA